MIESKHSNAGKKSKAFSEKRIFIKSDINTKYIHLGRGSQVGLAVTGVAFVCWSLFATGAYIANSVSAQNETKQISTLENDFVNRLETVALERDNRALEAESSQQKFVVALKKMSEQQNELLAFIEKNNELELGVNDMRDKLNSVLLERDSLRDMLASAKKSLESDNKIVALDGINASELKLTIDTLNATLGTVVTERDRELANTQELTSELALIKKDTESNTKALDAMLTNLEDAMDVTLTPLNTLFKSPNVNTDALLKEVRKNHSGIGGPVQPFEASNSSLENSRINKRYANLMKDMDKVNLMRIAATKLPYAMPLKGNFRFTSGYGRRWGRTHKGVDFAASKGTPIYATASGVVTFAGRQSGYGNLVKIRHAQGFETRYAHMNKIRTKKGARVAVGTRIGDMGTTGRSTGVHLHYEIRIGGNAVNPMRYIKAGRNVF